MKMLFLAPVLACSLAFGADVIAKDANITLDGKMIGKIEVLTPVEVVEKGDKTSKAWQKWATTFMKPQPTLARRFFTKTRLVRPFTERKF